MIAPNMLSLAGDMAHVPVRSMIRRFSAQMLSLIPEGMEKMILRHHRAAFVGCFSLHLRKNIKGRNGFTTSS